MSGMQDPLQKNHMDHSIVNLDVSEHATLQAPFPPPNLTLVSTSTLLSQVDSHTSSTACGPKGTSPFSQRSTEPNKPDQNGFNVNKLQIGNGYQEVKTKSMHQTGDNRTVFVPEHYPWHCIGKVRTPGGWTTGTMVGPRHVLTAAHGLHCKPEEEAGRKDYDWVSFTPSYYDGHSSMGEHRVTEVVALQSGFDGKHQTPAAAFDYVVLILEDRVGDTLGWAGVDEYGSNTHGSLPFQYFGFALDKAMGERPTMIQGHHLGIVEEKGRADGLEGYMLADLKGFTPGFLGGPVWYFPTASNGDDDCAGPVVVGVGGEMKGVMADEAGFGDRDYECYGGGPALAKLVQWTLSHRA